MPRYEWKKEMDRSRSPSSSLPAIVGEDTDMADNGEESLRIPDVDAYFEAIQSRKKLPSSLQMTLTSAFAHIPVSSFPEVPGGKVIEVPANTTVSDAVRILSEYKILSAPVTNPEADDSLDWRKRYLGIVDYSAIILWILENAELAAGSATPTGIEAGCAPVAADHLGENFYEVLLKEEPFKSKKVQSIIKSFRWAPFLPVASGSSMLTVLLLLSKYRLRNVPVIEAGKPFIKNFITQSAVIKGLQQCKGRDWFDCISSCPLSDVGLPFMSYDGVIYVKSDELILEAFKRMKDNKIGGLPVLEGPNRKIVGSISIRDIRFLLLTPELFSNFRHLNVMDFLESASSLGPEVVNSSVLLPPTCAPDDLLGTVIDTLASRGVHRIYVVKGKDREVLGVITLRDVISCFVNEPPNHFDNYFGFGMKEMLKENR